MPTPFLFSSPAPPQSAPEVNSAYGEMEYTIGYAQLLSLGLSDPALEVEGYVDGVKIGESTFPDLDGKSVALSANFYSWKFDARAVAKRWFDNWAAFPSVATKGVLSNAGWQADITLRLFLWIDDGTGTLVREAVYTETSLVKAINSTANLREPQSYEDFGALPGATVTGEYRYLTDKPDRVLVGYDESEWLAFLSYGVLTVEVRTYNADGTVRGVVHLPTPGGSNQDQQLLQVGVGPANINALEPGDYTYIQGDITIDSNVAYYIVRAGWGCPDGSLWAFYAPRRYFPVDPKFRTYRFHFLNSFGAVDSVSLYFEAQEAYDVQSTEFLAPLPAPLVSNARSATRLQSVATTRLQCRAQNLTPQEAEFFKVFLRSPNVYLEDGGVYYAMVIKDNDFQYKNLRRGLLEISFEAAFSVYDISQTN